MGVVISQDSTLGRELWSWDHTTREIHPADEDKPAHEQLHGRRPAIPLEYPKMLYKAQIRTNGKASVGEAMPHPMYFQNPGDFERECLFVEGFNRSCQRIVKDRDDEARAARDGWCVTQTEALEKLEGLQQDMANAAAEAAFSNRRMSAKAQEEYAEAEQQTHKHVVDVKPRRKRGRPAKGVEPVTGDAA